MNKRREEQLIKRNMSWIVRNWVERRAAKEQHLRNAGEVWKKAQAAIMEACDSLNEHYTRVAKIQRTQVNDRIVIKVMHQASGQPGSEPDATILSIEFDRDKRVITVMSEDNLLHEFGIQADSDHAFVTLKGIELLFDEFSRLALEQVFFTTTQAITHRHKLRLVT